MKWNRFVSSSYWTRNIIIRIKLLDFMEDRRMSVDNRIPSEPYMELNGVKVYAENDNKPFVNIDKEKLDGKEH